ncbi:MAG: SpoIVB peptidase [Lachnospiraceae bacterium]|nr:SpoIVB peptidase [Lachnospiraceae bacterium]
MGKKKRFWWLYVLFGFGLGIFTLALYGYYLAQIPDTIRIKAGTSERFDLQIPASGTVNADSSTVIALNQPVTLIAGETMDTYQMELKLFGIVPFKNIEIEIVEDILLTPIGQPIGIYMKTQGVLVVDIGSFSSADGERYSPAENKLQVGDYILAVDGIAANDKKQVREYVEENGDREIVFQISRQDELLQVVIKPETDEGGVYKIGAWLRDSAQGIGTMTYVDSNNNFGALGHGVNDNDTGELLTLGNGLLYQAEIVNIKKGEKGSPGELTGVIEYNENNVYGMITTNSTQGIYGVVGDNYQVNRADALPAGFKQEVEVGDAQIYCNVNGEAAYYDVKITKLSLNHENLNRQISIEVVDEELLALTGGIVQGMSGSPIVQNGKIIGAVTHVLVNDPTRGYGIFIEEMLKN